MQLVGMAPAGAAMGSPAGMPATGLFAGVFSQALQTSAGQQTSAPWVGTVPSADGESLPQDGQALPLMLGWMQRDALTQEQAAALSSFLAADAARSEAAFDALLQKMPPQLQEQIQQRTAGVDQAPHQVLQAQLLAVLQGYAQGGTLSPDVTHAALNSWQSAQDALQSGRALNADNTQPVPQHPAAQGEGLSPSDLDKQVTPILATQLATEEGVNVSAADPQQPRAESELAPVSSVVKTSEQPSGLLSSQPAPVSEVVPHQSIPQSVDVRTGQLERSRIDTSGAAEQRLASEPVIAPVTAAVAEDVKAPVAASAQGVPVPAVAVNTAPRANPELRARSETSATTAPPSLVAGDDASSVADQATQTQTVVRSNAAVMPPLKAQNDNIAQVAVDNTEGIQSQSGRSGATDWLQAATQSLNALKPAVTTQPQLQMPAGMAPTHPGWSQSLSERVVWSAGQQLQSATIQLDPPELGSLHVKLQVVQDQVSVTFTSPHASVREAVEQSMPRLRELFEQQGLNLGESMVKDQSQGREQRQQQSYAQAERLGGQVSGAAEATSTAQVSQSLSLVDYYA